jgi:TrmH family RNA methyltransferase
MVSKAQIQFIRSLDRKKERDESRCFIAEGDKIVREVLSLPAHSPFRVQLLCGLDSWLEANAGKPANQPEEVCTVSETELERMSLMKTPNQALAVVRMQEASAPAFNFSDDLLFGLDKVQDPGNTGTIIRLAEWFGVAGVIASLDSADLLSPKVVQASMGSVFRVKLVQTTLDPFLLSLPRDFPVYATTLSGTSVYETTLTKNGIILMGNESKGLTTRYLQLATCNLSIPDFALSTKPESLNVSLAAAILCSEFRRR